MSQPIKLGIIGLSVNKSTWANMAHAGPLTSEPLSKRYKLTAVATSSDKTAKAAAEAYSLPAEKAYHSAKDIAEDKDVDMVVVSVTLALHKELSVPVLEAGKMLFVEWPLGSGLKEAEELAGLAREKGVKTAVGLQSRCLPITLKAKEIVDSGKLGRILTTHLTMSSSNLMLLPERYRMMNTPKSEANHISIASAHILDPLCLLLGEFKSLNATTSISNPTLRWVRPDGSRTEPEPRTLPDSISIQGVTTKGTAVSFMNNSVSENIPDHLEWVMTGEYGSLKISGASSFLGFAPPTLSIYLPKEKEGEAKTSVYEKPEMKVEWEVVDYGPSPVFGGIGPVYERFAEGKEGTWADFDDAVMRHRMVEAVYRSAETGGRESYL